jgi:hypothetical protein
MDRWRIGRLLVLAGGLGMLLGAVLAGVDEDAHRDQPSDAIDFLGTSSEVAVWLSLLVVGLAAWHFRAWGLGKLVVVGLVAAGSLWGTLGPDRAYGTREPLWSQGYGGVELVARWVVVASSAVALVGVLWSLVEWARSADVAAVSLAWWRKQWGLVVGGFAALLVVGLIYMQISSSDGEQEPPADLADQGDGVDVQDEWSISADGDAPGSYIFSMIKTFSGVEEADVEDLGGRLVWPETEIELCDVNIWGAGEGFVQVGIVSPTTEGCPGMLRAFVDFALPQTTCLFIRVDGIDDEHCAPLAVATTETDSEP